MVRNSIKKAAVTLGVAAVGLLSVPNPAAEASSGFTVRVEPLSNTFLFLDVSGGSAGDGTKIIQWSLSGDNQVWTFQPSGSYYRIVNRKTGKCVMSDGVAGHQLFQWACKDSQAQLWDTSLTAGNGLGYSIRNVASNLYMEVSGASGAQGAAIDTWPWNGARNQFFVATTAY